MTKQMTIVVIGIFRVKCAWERGESQSHKRYLQICAPCEDSDQPRICVTVAKYINELGALAVTCQRKVVGLNPIAVDKSLRP